MLTMWRPEEKKTLNNNELVGGQRNHFTRKQLDMSFEQWKLNRDNLKDITQKIAAVDK